MILPSSIIILDSGNPAFSAANPLATPYEYQPITNNTPNTLTINNGTRAAYAGTTPHAYFAGATVAAVLLAEDLNASIGMSLLYVQNMNGLTTVTFNNIPQNFAALLLVAKLKHNAAVTTANVGIRFNSDSTSPHYYSSALFSANASPTYANTADQSQINECLTSAGTTNSDFAANYLLIPGYAQADAAHNCLQLGSHYQYLVLGGGLWQPASSQTITRIDTTSPGAAFVAGSNIWVYGLGASV